MGEPNLASLSAQFRAQLAALQDLQAGRLPPDSTVLAACRGTVPAAAVSVQTAAATGAGPACRLNRAGEQRAMRSSEYAHHYPPLLLVGARRRPSSRMRQPPSSSGDRPAAAAAAAQLQGSAARRCPTAMPPRHTLLVARSI